MHHGITEAIGLELNAKNCGEKLLTAILLLDILEPSTGSLEITTKVKSMIVGIFLNKILAIFKIKILL